MIPSQNHDSKCRKNMDIEGFIDPAKIVYMEISKIIYIADPFKLSKFSILKLIIIGRAKRTATFDW